MNQYNKNNYKDDSKKNPIDVLKRPVNIAKGNKDYQQNLQKEEIKLYEFNDYSSNDGRAQKLPDTHVNKFPQSEGWVPSIPQKSERWDTFETDISALNLSPKSKASMKLRRLINMSFKMTGKAPDSTSDFYRIGKVLGRGAFGKVNLTIHRLSEEMVAIKSINKEFLTDEASKNKVMKEVRILKKMRHKNIVQLYDTFETNKHIIFVMELCSGGDLLNYVRKRRRLSEDYAKAIFKQILEALHYCHKLNILHRDIKLDNIILDSEGVIKIGDFGVSKIIEPGQTMYDQCGTPAYIAPEILRDKGYIGWGIDVWSAGVVLYAMLYGTVPFRAQNMNDLHDMIIKAKYSLKSDISEVSRDLLKKILEPDPRKRLSIPEILAHPWFADLKEDLEMFNEQEKEKIKIEFSYNDVRKYNRNMDTDISWDFTEHHLETIDNDDLRNLTTKSIILAPFNSTTSHISTDRELSMKNVADKKIIKFNAKCRDFNRQYEMNNNCELDNGVYNKFMCSSRASLNFSPSQQEDGGRSDGLSGGDSLQLSFNKNENPEDVQESSSKIYFIFQVFVLLILILVDLDKQIEEEIKIEQERKDKHGQTEFQKATQEIEGKYIMPLTNYIENSKQHEVISMDIVQEIWDYGYPERFIIESIQNNEINYATASYYLLKKRVMIDNSYHMINYKKELELSNEK